MTKRKNTRNQKARKRWDFPNWSEPAPEVVAEYRQAADRLIFGSTPQAEWSEAQQLGHHVSEMLAAVFRAPPDAETIAWLKRCVASYMKEPSLQWRRYRAVQEIAYWGTRLNDPEWTDPEKRMRALATLRHNLGAADLALRELFGGVDGLEALAERLKPFDPEPRLKKDKMGAEGILATIIVLDTERGALGLVASGDDEDAIDRVRTKIDSDVRSLRDQLNQL